MNVKIYSGDSKQGAMVRAQSNEVIKATDPEFDNFAGITYADLKVIYGTLLKCKDWGPGVSMISQGEMYALHKPQVDKILKSRKRK